MCYYFFIGSGNILKKVTRAILIILMIPLLVIIQQAATKEWTEAQVYKDKIGETIDLPEPSITIPISMTDNNGRIFAEEYVEWRQPLSLESIPDFVQHLFLVSEDQGFFEHKGVQIFIGTIADLF